MKTPKWILLLFVNNLLQEDGMQIVIAAINIPVFSTTLFPLPITFINRQDFYSIKQL